jgi:hypothetical protein
MGYDLMAKRPSRGAADYYRSGIEFMIFLRCAMVAAGVSPALVYKKFISNDGFLVTPLQSRTIAKRLTTWLKGRNLVLDLAERTESALLSTEGLFEVLNTMDSRSDRARRLALLRTAKSLPYRVDRRARKTLRQFAAFCAGSGGFRVW